MISVLTTEKQRKIKKKWRTAAIIISLALILISATSTAYLTVGVTKQIDDIKHSYQLSQQVDMLRRLTFDMKASAKGYLLTSEPKYLVSYDYSLNFFRETLDALASIVMGEPDKEAKIRTLHDLIDEVYQVSGDESDFPKKNGVNAVITRLGKTEVDTILERLDENASLFLSEESVQLTQRNEKIDKTRQWLTVTSLLALLSAVVLVALLFSSLLRAVRRLNEGQNVLRSENEVLEQKVLQRTVELQHEREVAERERHRVEVLLQDSSHRIGNSLAQVSSLLSLQLRQVSSEDARNAIDSARARIHTISSAHRRLRLGMDLDTARVDEFLNAVVQDIRQASYMDGIINIQTDFSTQSFHARDVTTIGIILGELVTNALKHAFHDKRDGEVYIRFQPEKDGHYRLTVRDTGSGWDGEKNCNGLGALVVEQLSQQYGGTPKYSRHMGQGTQVDIEFTSLEPAE